MRYDISGSFEVGCVFFKKSGHFSLQISHLKVTADWYQKFNNSKTAYMCNSHGFLIPSRWGGFGIALNGAFSLLIGANQAVSKTITSS